MESPGFSIQWMSHEQSEVASPAPRRPAKRLRPDKAIVVDRDDKRRIRHPKANLLESIWTNGFLRWTSTACRQCSSLRVCCESSRVVRSALVRTNRTSLSCPRPLERRTAIFDQLVWNSRWCISTTSTRNRRNRFLPPNIRCPYEWCLDRRPRPWVSTSLARECQETDCTSIRERVVSDWTMSNGNSTHRWVWRHCRSDGRALVHL